MLLLVAAGVLVVHEPLPGLLEVSQTGLQVAQSARIGPGLPVLSSSPNVGHCQDAEMLKTFAES